MFKVKYTLLCFTTPKPRCPALCKPKGPIAFKLDLVMLFSINTSILFKIAEFAHQKKKAEKEKHLLLSLRYGNL